MKITNIKNIHKKIITVVVVAAIVLAGDFLYLFAYAATPPVPVPKVLFIQGKPLTPVTLNTLKGNTSSTIYYQKSNGEFSQFTKTTINEDGTMTTRGNRGFMGSDQQMDGIIKSVAQRKASETAKEATGQAKKFLGNFLGMPSLNTDGCSLVTPGQSTNYGNMYGEHGVSKEQGGKDAYGKEATKGVQSDINKRLMDADLGYLRKEDFEIAKQAPELQSAVAKHQKSNAEWAGWGGETPLPTAENAKEHLDSKGGGYHTKGGSKMRPSGRETGKGSYLKGRTYETADGGYAKVTDDCSFVPATKEDWDKWQQSNQKAANPGGTSSLVPDSQSSLASNDFSQPGNNVGANSSVAPSVTNAFSNLLPFSFNLVNSLSSSIFSLLST